MLPRNAKHPNENIPVDFLPSRISPSRKSDISYRVRRFHASPRPQDARDIHEGRM